MNFRQQDACAKLVMVLARMDMPDEHADDPDAILLAIDDAASLYNLIEEARDILRMKSDKTA